MHSEQICRVCKVCAFTRPELCSAYRLIASIHGRDSFRRAPDVETYLHYLQSGLADELFVALEDFLADIKARLTGKQFEVLISHVYHGRPLKEIARKEGVTVEAARQRLNSAIIKIRCEWNGKRKSRRRKGHRGRKRVSR